MQALSWVVVCVFADASAPRFGRKLPHPTGLRTRFLASGRAGVYENGKLVLPRPLSLPEKSQVRVTIESDSERDDPSNLLDKTRRNRVLRELDDSEGW